jgi:hypothetical protein
MTHTHIRDETLMCVKKQQSMLLEQRTAIAPVNNFNDKSVSSAAPAQQSEDTASSAIKNETITQVQTPR